MENQVRFTYVVKYLWNLNVNRFKMMFEYFLNRFLPFSKLVFAQDHRRPVVLPCPFMWRKNFTFCLSLSLSLYLSIYISIYLSLWNTYLLSLCSFFTSELVPWIQPKWSIYISLQLLEWTHTHHSSLSLSLTLTHSLSLSLSLSFKTIKKYLFLSLSLLFKTIKHISFFSLSLSFKTINIFLSSSLTFLSF